MHEGVTEAYGEAFVEGGNHRVLHFRRAKRKGDLKKEIDGARRNLQNATFVTLLEAANFKVRRTWV